VYEIKAGSVQISSPGYPRNYAGGQTCAYVIKVGHGTRHDVIVLCHVMRHDVMVLYDVIKQALKSTNV
jgi:hypothetical protein